MATPPPPPNDSYTQRYPKRPRLMDWETRLCNKSLQDEEDDAVCEMYANESIPATRAPPIPARPMAPITKRRVSQEGEDDEEDENSDEEYRGGEGEGADDRESEEDKKAKEKELLKDDEEEDDEEEEEEEEDEEDGEEAAEDDDNEGGNENEDSEEEGDDNNEEEEEDNDDEEEGDDDSDEEEEEGDDDEEENEDAGDNEPAGNDEAGENDEDDAGNDEDNDESEEEAEEEEEEEDEEEGDEEEDDDDDDDDDNDGNEAVSNADAATQADENDTGNGGTANGNQPGGTVNGDIFDQQSGRTNGPVSPPQPEDGSINQPGLSQHDNAASGHSEFARDGIQIEDAEVETGPVVQAVQTPPSIIINLNLPRILTRREPVSLIDEMTDNKENISHPPGFTQNINRRRHRFRRSRRLSRLMIRAQRRRQTCRKCKARRSEAQIYECHFCVYRTTLVCLDCFLNHDCNLRNVSALPGSRLRSTDFVQRESIRHTIRLGNKLYALRLNINVPRMSFI